MSGEIKHVFCREKLTHEDGSIQWNVVHEDSWERIGSFANEDDALELEMDLNLACTDASEKPGAVINC